MVSSWGPPSAPPHPRTPQPSSKRLKTDQPSLPDRDAEGQGEGRGGEEAAGVREEAGVGGYGEERAAGFPTRR